MRKLKERWKGEKKSDWRWCKGMRNGSVGTSKGYYKGIWMGKRKGKKKVLSWWIRLKERREYQELELANPQCETELVQSRIEE